MTGRERLLAAIEFGSPDRLPLHYAITRIARERYGEEVADLEQGFPGDFGPCGTRFLDIDRSLPGIQKDKWGCVWRNETPGLIGMVVENPLSAWEQRKTYRFPEPEDLLDVSGIEAAIDENAGEKMLVASGQWLWQRMFWVRGFENILLDIAEEREEVLWLRDRVLEVQKGVLQMLLPFDLDAIWFLDDWGAQRGLLIRPESWRRILRDAYAELFGMVHAAGKKVCFHTDGDVGEILEDLIAIGADVLNLQIPTIDASLLLKHVPGRVCLLGGLDLQGVLAGPDPEAVRRHVLDILDRFATPAGGYIGQVIMDETTSMENARAAAETLAAWRP